ncbi:MAG: hypothetical protein Q4G52_11750 [Clostridia bacterium]|nr:hypothetical protein [Clostridia bacterium]
MDQVKELLNIIVGSCLVVEGKGRTFVKAPMWLAVLAALSSLRLTALTVLLVIAFGMRARIVKA